MSGQQPQTIRDVDLRIGRALNDYLERKARGSAEPEENFIARHPDFAEELHAHLDLLRDLKPGPASLSQLIAQGTLEPGDDAEYPARLGSYQVAEFIGRGGMGVVLKAHDEQLRRWVALKLLRPELADDTAALTRFTREARAAAALRHPNIVTVYAVGQVRHVPYLAMELVNGPSLAEVIRAQGPLPTETVRAVFRQLLTGLAAAHAAGLIHRDVKPSNILLDNCSTRSEQGLAGAPAEGSSLLCSEPRASARAVDRSPSAPEHWTMDNGQSPIVKLADFGLARMLSAQTRVTLPQSLLGTPEYMSPEQARGADEVDHRSDLYSAGVVLYEMLTGSTPFRADTPAAVIHRILSEDPRPPRQPHKNADPHLASLTLRLLAKRPEDRFASAPAALAALETGARVAAPEKRRRLMRRSVIGVCSLALACVGVWLSAELTALGPISDVRVEEIDGNPTTKLLATYGILPFWRVFHTFPKEAHHVTAAQVIDCDGAGRNLVVASTFYPLRGNSLFAFDREARESWALDLSEPSSWPDRPPAQFRCDWLGKVEVDGQPGDELVVSACEVDHYPTRVSIVDPRDGRIRSTFRHLGQLPRGQILDDFFGEGRPGILAWGMNNTPGLLGSALSTNHRLPAHWDMVQVILILDPRNMKGPSSPYDQPLSDALPGPIHAYAFMDLPYNRGRRPALALAEDGREQLPVTSEMLAANDIAHIAAVGNSILTPDPGTGPWFQLTVQTEKEDGTARGRAFLTVDRNLALRHVEGIDKHINPEADEMTYWERYWRPVVQDGQQADAARSDHAP